MKRILITLFSFAALIFEAAAQDPGQLPVIPNDPAGKVVSFPIVYEKKGSGN